jgi:hypothetical protein
MPGEIGGGGEAAQLLRERVGDVADARAEFLDPARRVQHPELVPQMLLDHTRDGRYGERRERGPEPDVESGHGLDQGERGDLPDVLRAGPGTRVASREGVREVQVSLHEPFA